MNHDEYMQKRFEQIEKLVKDFSGIVNTFSFGEKENNKFFESFQKEHPTLQQSMMGVVFFLMAKVASEDYRTDGRNEQSKKIAQMFIRGFAEELSKIEKERMMEAGCGEDYADSESGKIMLSVIEDPVKYLYLPLI